MAEAGTAESSGVEAGEEWRGTVESVEEAANEGKERETQPEFNIEQAESERKLPAWMLNSTDGAKKADGDRVSLSPSPVPEETGSPLEEPENRQPVSILTS